MISLDVPALRALIVDAVREALAARPGDDEILSVARAAELADVAPATIREWIKEGRLRRHGVGRMLRVKRSELVCLLTAPAAHRNGDSPEDAVRRRDARKAFTKPRIVKGSAT